MCFYSIIFCDYLSIQWLQVVSIAGNEVFHLTTTLYNQATKGSTRYADMDKVDTRVNLDVSSFQFVFLYRHISQLIVSGISHLW